MLKILGKASSINVRKVLWTCVELGLPFEREDWGSGFQPTDAPAFRRSTQTPWCPSSRTATSRCGNRTASSASTATARSTRSRRACAVDQWMDWQATDLNRSWSYAFMALARQSPAHQDPAAIQASQQAWTQFMGILEQRLQATGGHVAGAGFAGGHSRRPVGQPVVRDAFREAGAAGGTTAGIARGYRRHGRNGPRTGMPATRPALSRPPAAPARAGPPDQPAHQRAVEADVLQVAARSAPARRPDGARPSS